MLQPEPHQLKFRATFVIIGIVFVIVLLSIWFFFEYIRSERELTKSFAKMQEMGKNLSIEECAKKNIEWYQSCQALTQLCDQSVSSMMKVCLVNGEKSSQCEQYGQEIYGYNFGATECKPYFSKKNLKKACADTYQTIANFCKAVASSKG